MGLRSFLRNVIARRRKKKPENRGGQQTREPPMPSQTIVIDGKTLEVIVEGPYQETRLPIEHRKSVLESLITPVIRTITANVVRVVVGCTEKSMIKVTYYNQLGHSIREDVIPQIAFRAAYDDAVKAVVAMRQQGFDEEIVTVLQDKLNQRNANIRKKR